FQFLRAAQHLVPLVALDGSFALLQLDLEVRVTFSQQDIGDAVRFEAREFGRQMIDLWQFLGRVDGWGRRIEQEISPLVGLRFNARILQTNSDSGQRSPYLRISHVAVQHRLTRYQLRCDHLRSQLFRRLQRVQPDGDG